MIDSSHRSPSLVAQDRLLLLPVAYCADAPGLRQPTLLHQTGFPGFAAIFACNANLFPETAWNKKSIETSTFPVRTYLSPGFSHLLGYVSYPMQDKSGNYWQNEFIGKDGLEKQYNDILKGENGMKIIEADVFENIQS